MGGLKERYKTMLSLNNIEVIYSKVILVLRGVSLELNDGAIVCLLGANGTGKTTVLKSISGLLKTELGEITGGTITFDGQRIDKQGPEEISRLGIIQVLEGRRLFTHFTVEEDLRVGASLAGGGHKVERRMEQVFDYFPKLRSLRSHTTGYLSGGEQQMLVVARALMSWPKVLLTDEPSLGLAPSLVKELFRRIKSINETEGTSILLVEQNAKAALDIADYGYVMENGRIVLDGPAPKLKENEDVREFYLGLSQVGERKSYRDVKRYKRRKRWLG